jgi:hypothetical protein
MNVKNAFLLLVAVVVAGIGWQVFRPSEEKRVRAVFDRAAELVVQKPGEGDVFHLMRAQRLSDLIADEIRLTAPAFNLDHSFAAGAVPRLAAMLWSANREFSVGFERLEVEFPSESQSLVRGEVLVSGSGEWFSGRDVYEFSSELLKGKDDNEWRFRAFEMKPVVERAPVGTDAVIAGALE